MFVPFWKFIFVRNTHTDFCPLIVIFHLTLLKYIFGNKPTYQTGRVKAIFLWIRGVNFTRIWNHRCIIFIKFGHSFQLLFSDLHMAYLDPFLLDIFYVVCRWISNLSHIFILLDFTNASLESYHFSIEFIFH